MADNSEYWPANDPRYKTLGIDIAQIPRSESLKDVLKRTSQFWNEVIVNDLRKKKKVRIIKNYF
jgi:2,3-bisphosphoglycerate-dependent phosphoglycerate mutase